MFVAGCCLSGDVDVFDCSSLGDVVEGVGGVDGVPVDDGVGDDGDAFGVKVLVVDGSAGEFSLA